MVGAHVPLAIEAIGSDQTLVIESRIVVEPEPFILQHSTPVMYSELTAVYVFKLVPCVRCEEGCGWKFANEFTKFRFLRNC